MNHAKCGICKRSGCLAVFVRLRTWGQPREYCSGACKQAARRKRMTPAARARKNKLKLARKCATKGRICKWCTRTDAEHRFETERECCRCYRQRLRRSCGSCGGPFYVISTPAQEVIGCAVRTELPPGVCCTSVIEREEVA